jgi:hypothetical protein
MITLFYSVVIGLTTVSNTINVPTLGDCLREKERIETYYLNTYRDVNYVITVSCSKNG